MIKSSASLSLVWVCWFLRRITSWRTYNQLESVIWIYIGALLATYQIMDGLKSHIFEISELISVSDHSARVVVLILPLHSNSVARYEGINLADDFRVTSK